MRTIKEGGQIETKHFISSRLQQYRSLHDLMKDEREYKKIRAELILPTIRIADNGVVLVRTFKLESWSGTITRNFYFVFDAYNRLVPNFKDPEVPVDRTCSILCMVYDPPYNMDNANVEFCVNLNSLYIEPLSRDRNTPAYKLRDTTVFSPGRGIPSVYELSDMIKDHIQLSESHEFDTLRDLRRSKTY